MSEDDVVKIMGANTFDYLMRTLPPITPPDSVVRP